MKFVLQLLTIRVTNDTKLRMGGSAEKRKRNVAEYYTRDHTISNCGKTKLTREPERRTFRERVRLLEIVAITKVSISRKFIYVYRWNRFYVLQQQQYRSTERGVQNFIFIFDDVACDKQDTVREYFSMGRHANVDCFYLCQTYVRILKHLIRNNANLLILFKQDSTNLKYIDHMNIYIDHMNIDMSYNEFCALCRDYWLQKWIYANMDF